MRHLARLGREYDLIPCGGSEYHGLGNSGKNQPGTLEPPEETVKLLEDAAAKVRLENSNAGPLD